MQVLLCYCKFCSPTTTSLVHTHGQSLYMTLDPQELVQSLLCPYITFILDVDMDMDMDMVMDMDMDMDMETYLNW